MCRMRKAAVQAIGRLQTARIELEEGFGTVDAVRKLGIAEQTYYR